ncbi:hypothetical protein JCM11251_003770 [Rhodosporidiobolus azoricus]
MSQNQIRQSSPLISSTSSSPKTPKPDSTLAEPHLALDIEQLLPAPDALPDATDETLAAFLQHLPSGLPCFDPNDLSALPFEDFGEVLDPVPPDMSLVPARPQNWAIQAMQGDEADWEDEEESSSDLDRITRLIQRRPMEPAMYPEHLFSVQYDHGSRFFMPSQRFCIAYLYRMYFTLIGETHRPSLRMTELAPPFAFALSVVGAGLFQTSSSFHQELSHVKRDFAAEHLTEVIVHETERLPRVQTLLLYQLVGAFGNSHEERDYTRKHHPGLVQAFLDITPPSTPVPHDLDLSSKDLERAWRTWIERETYVRVAFLCYLLDLRTGADFGDQARLLSHSHSTIADLPLPAPEAVWNAANPTEWRRAMSEAASPATTFRNALNALLSKTPPKRDSPAARIISSLSRQSPFSVTILSQTLLTLQSQIAASQRVLRTFATSASPTIGGPPIPALDAMLSAAPRTDLMEAAANSAKDSMERIVFGQKVLRMLGGAAASTAWFRGVEPIFE